MIQASTTKPIEMKAAAKADVSGKAAKVSNDLEGSLEAMDFANELEASLGKVQVEAGVEAEVTGEILEAKVLPVQVSADQVLEMPSTLVNQQVGNIDAASPKVFDPAMTKGVEKLIQPNSTQVVAPITDAQVLEIANAEVILPSEVKTEVAQALLKTPQVVTGRSPAIDFAQSEIDPQLLNMEDFVGQKNLVTKKNNLPNSYGMKATPQQQNIALENGLKQSQVVTEVSAVDSRPVNSQQFILNMMNEQQGTPSNQVNETQAAPKVFDMGQVKSGNVNEIINQITDYVIQAKAAKEPTVNMRMNHDQLGIIDVTVSKMNGSNAADAVAINIGAHSLEGKNFFQQNSKELFSHMASAGINLSDLKVETPSQTAKNEFDFGSQSGKNQHGSDKQFGSEQNQRRHDQQRRQDLWNLLNQEAA